MNTVETLRRAIQLARQRELARLPSNPLVRRVDSKRGKVVARRMRAKSSSSMMDMGEPKGHRRLPLYPDERTKALFMAYKSRK